MINAENNDFGEHKVPTKVIISYGRDLDLFKFHNFMLMTFKSRKDASPYLESKAKVLLSKYSSGNLSQNEKRNVNKEHRRLLEISKKWKSNDDIDKYMSCVKNILSDYKTFSSGEVIDLDKTSNKDDNLFDRLRCIEEFVSVVKNFIKVDITRTFVDQTSCVVCGKAFREGRITEDCNCYICECGYSFFLTSKEVSYHDPYQLNFSVPSDNNLIVDAINKFCGRRSGMDVPKILYEHLDNYMIKHNLEKGSYYKSLPVENHLNKEKIGNKHGTSVKMLINILKETNNSFCYEDVNFIGHKYFGWILPDLSEHIKIIVSVGDLAKIISERTSSKTIPPTMLLFFILQFLKIPSCVDDFKLMDTSDSYENYKEIWRNISEDKEMIKIREEWFKSNNIVIKNVKTIVI